LTPRPIDAGSRRSARRRPGSVAAAILAVALPLGGCAALVARPPRVTVDARDVGGSASRIELDADGTLRWGGGFDAIEGRTTWEGRLTDDERRRLDAILDELEGGTPASSADRGTLPRWRIVVTGPESLDVRLAGLDGASADLVALLDEAARRRHRRALDALPTAGQRR